MTNFICPDTITFHKAMAYDPLTKANKNRSIDGSFYYIEYKGKNGYSYTVSYNGRKERGNVYVHEKHYPYKSECFEEGESEYETIIRMLPAGAEKILSDAESAMLERRAYRLAPKDEKQALSARIIDRRESMKRNRKIERLRKDAASLGFKLKLEKL